MAITMREATEHEIQQMIINYLRLKGYYVIRLNSGRMSYEYKGRRSFMMLAEKGTPDLMAFKEIERSFDSRTMDQILDLIFIEVKRPGKKPTYLQEQKMKELQEYGARCIVATSIGDLEKLVI